VKSFKHLFNLNPFFHLAVSYQEVLFFTPDTMDPETGALIAGGFGHLWWLLAMGGASIVFFFAAYWVFDRLRDSFAEVV
jgi:ABC-type polysaccharide/polyol phosphate export permease